MSRQTLGTARTSKKDEFYTLYDDVKFELDHYIDQFKDKVIYCPCDTDKSAFVRYFLELEAKGLIKELIYTSLQNGTDFLGDAAIDGYKHSDIVITNPPFSLFRQFLSLLDELNCKFIVWGSINAISYRKTSEMLVKDRIRIGYTSNKTCMFEVPDEYFKSLNSKAFENGDKYYVNVPSCTVFTNLNVVRQPLHLIAKFNDSYVKYSNFDALNVNKVSEIPSDYYDLMGVPITYLSKHDSSKFEILGIFNNFDSLDFENGRIIGDLVRLDKAPWRTRGPCINGNQAVYARVIIKRKAGS